MLTRDEWAAHGPPIYWVTVDDWMDRTTLIRDIIVKWCDEYLDGWSYRDYNTFAFGSEKDRTTFLMFYKSGVWNEDSGELLPNNL